MAMALFLRTSGSLPAGQLADLASAKIYTCRNQEMIQERRNGGVSWYHSFRDGMLKERKKETRKNLIRMQQLPDCQRDRISRRSLEGM